MKIDIKDLKDKVPDIIFRQGLDYFKDGRVKIKQTDNLSVMATVHGTYPYVTRLVVDGNSFRAVAHALTNMYVNTPLPLLLKLLKIRAQSKKMNRLKVQTGANILKNLLLFNR